MDRQTDTGRAPNHDLALPPDLLWGIVPMELDPEDRYTPTVLGKEHDGSRGAILELKADLAALERTAGSLRTCS